MAITKRTRIDRCEVDQRTGIISIRSQPIIEDDGVEIARGGYIRLTITPTTPATPEFNAQIALVGDADDRTFVRRIAIAVFTPEVVAAFPS